MEASHHMIDSPQLGRPVHLWRYGWFGMPMLVFPSAAGMAHEWHAQGMVDALSPLIAAGRIKLYCTESNVADAFTRKEGHPAHRMQKHLAFERYVIETLVPAIRQDCRSDQMPLATAGCSLGALYSANMALKFPEIFRWALCMSGRYELRHFTDGHDDIDVYFNNPLSYVANLHGDALERIQRHTHLNMVCGRGAYEEGCIEETIAIGGLFRSKGIPHTLDIWGRDSAHQWPWWRRQAVHHFGQAFANG